MARIVFTTLGSFGDLHPYLAIAMGMRDRGHATLVATSEVYRAKVESEGIGFASVRPDVGEMVGDTEFLKKLWDPRRSSEFLIRKYIMPRVADSFDDLMPVCQGADLLVSHVITYAAPVIAELRKLRWISVALQPLVFLSADDPSVVPQFPFFHHLRLLGHSPFSFLIETGKNVVRAWAEPVQQLRLRVGLPRSEKNLIFEGNLSPFGTLVLFSEHFARPQPDWPPNAYITGFPFYDREEAGCTMDPDLEEFLAAGSPPVVFTLGSSAVMQAGNFYHESLEAAKRMRIRAVLLTGINADRQLLTAKREGVYIAPYAPYSELLPHAAATVHQGGIGTTAQALRSGRPMVVVPWSHDQPDNANRARRLGVARVIPRSRYKASRVAVELEKILGDSSYAVSAAQLGKKIQDEDGIRASCEALEQVLRSGTM